MLNNILFALWFFAPAGFANAAPVFAKNIPALKWLGIPIDRGKTFAGKRILGDHKTYRGFAAGILLACLVVLLQHFLYQKFGFFRSISGSVKYDQWRTLFLGPLFGFGALGGDAVKSFFKRRVGVASGKSWFPFDQIDFIIGGTLATMLLVSISLEQYLYVLIVWFLLHPISTYIGWLIGMREAPL